MRLHPRFAVLLLVLFPCLAGAEVKIAFKNRMKNRPPGRCGWCALETLARHHHIKVLYGLTGKKASRSSPEDLEEVLIKVRVSYRIQHPGAHSTQILKTAIKEGRGAAVGLHELFPGAGGHIVTLVDFGPREVRVIDPSDARLRIHTMSLKRFLYWWDGFALVIEDQ